MTQDFPKLLPSQN